MSLPRFKAESEFSLKPALMDLGMKAAFDDADFTGMSPEGKHLFITHVLHKAFVDVNEEGSEAAAATAVVVKARQRSPSRSRSSSAPTGRSCSRSARTRPAPSCSWAATRGNSGLVVRRT